MKNYLFRCLQVIVLCFIMIVMSWLCIPRQYSKVYTAVVPEKYDRLMSIDEPKIILVGGSSMAFGINSEILQQKTGLQVVNLGMHAGLGSRYMLEMAKRNINEGDIVVFAPEYWNDAGLYMNPELALISCQDSLKLFNCIPAEGKKEALEVLPLYLKKKIYYWVTNTGISENDTTGTEYDPTQFNEYGDNITTRTENYASPDGIVKETYVFNPEAIDYTLCEYVNEINEYCAESGALLYVSFPPVCEISIDVTKEQMDEFIVSLDQAIDAQIISEPSDYIMPFEYFYGTNFHLTNKGADIRTNLLADDIINAGK